MPAGTQYSKQLNMDLNYVKTPAFYDTDNDEWLMGAAQFVKNASGLWVPVSETNPVPSKLTGSTIPDSQAVPMTQAQKDIVARAIDNIIDTIGAENIRVFLPMWETSGTEISDLLNNDVKFKVIGATLGVQGLLGRSISFDGVDDYLAEKPVFEATAGNTDVALDSDAKMIAQKIGQPSLGCFVGFSRVNLKIVGDPSASIVLEIQEDNADVPSGVAITNGTSGALPTSVLGETYQFRGFYFNPSPQLREDKTYWLVVKYSSVTTVNATNYVAVQVDNTGAYGRPYALYNGTTWTIVADQSMKFDLYNNAFSFLYNSDFSVIFGLKKSTLGGTLLDIGSNSMTAAAFYGGGACMMLTGADRYNTYIEISDSADGIIVGGNGYYFNYSDRWMVLAQTLGYADSTNKVIFYENGLVRSSVNGTANVGCALPVQPSVIGVYTTMAGTQVAYSTQWFGPLIITKSKLTAAQVAKVSHQLLALRKYGLGV